MAVTHLELPLPLLAHVRDLEHRRGEDGNDEGRRKHLVMMATKFLPVVDRSHDIR